MTISGQCWSNWESNDVRARAIAVFLLGFMLLSICTCTPIQQEWEVNAPRNAAAPSQAAEPLTIAGNAELSQQSIGGVGTRSDPYILSGLTIVTSGSCIYVRDTTAFFVIKDSDLESTGMLSAVIRFNGVENGIIEGCYLRGGPGGVQFTFCVDCTIRESTCIASSNAISITNSNNCTVHDCNVHDNIVGVLVADSNKSLIVNSSIYRNSQVGVLIETDSEGTTVYHNSIGWNGWNGSAYSNAFDDGSDSQFTNGVDSGNAWSDYSGFGHYDIPGTALSTDTLATLLTDTESPDIDPPLDKTFDVESSGNTLSWIATDDLPYSYRLSVDSVFDPIEVWDGREITISLDELPVGTHVLIIHVMDAAHNVAEDEVSVTAVSFMLGGLGTEWVLWGSILTVGTLILVIAIIKKMQ